METRKNTLKIVFSNKNKVPIHLDILRFVDKVLKISAAQVHSIYKDENDQSFYLKFMDENAFNQFSEVMEEQYQFSFLDGQISIVTLELASRQMRYIRIFNVPPETTDQEIAAVLGRYGKIRQHIRERYPASYEFPVYSGVRGIHMEVEKDIPANLWIGHFRARIFYEGLKNKCFFCKAEGHLKVNCPKLADLRGSEIGGETSGGGSKDLYSRVLTNVKVAKTNSRPTETKMTSLPLILRETRPEAILKQTPINLPNDPLNDPWDDDYEEQIIKPKLNEPEEKKLTKPTPKTVTPKVTTSATGSAESSGADAVNVEPIVNTIVDDGAKQNEKESSKNVDSSTEMTTGEKIEMTAPLEEEAAKTTTPMSMSPTQSGDEAETSEVWLGVKGRKGRKKKNDTPLESLANRDRSRSRVKEKKTK